MARSPTTFPKEEVTKRNAILGIILCLFAIEITRRGFGTVSCYLDLRYNPVSFYRFGLWEECVERIWLFPFYL